MILDVCAAPGGKTTAMAAAARESGQVVACDSRWRRMVLLRQTITLAGVTNVRLTQADATTPLPFAVMFDRVLVDAPCSGLGILRRDPDIRWRHSEADLAAFAETQTRILRNAADRTLPGGRLIYATCSTEPEENEQIVDAFLASDAAFVPVDARTTHPQLPPDVVDERGHLRTRPDRHGLEAFFGAVFERRKL
jgi:16S rRNA (cytosine967-C5)-methyltransferase